jgi:hypothetical protein
MKTKRVTTTNRLGTYLTATVGTSLLAAVQSDAAIVAIDIEPTGFNIAGPNGNAPSGDYRLAYDFPMAGGGLMVAFNGFDSQYIYGIIGVSGLEFATAGALLTPTNFSSGTPIGSGAFIVGNPYNSIFGVSGVDVVTDFGPNSFMGFRTAQGNYGWLEVTWTGLTNEFEILGGAYEDQAGVPIAAGAIPEPVSMLSTMGMLASGLLIRRRKLAA